MAGLIDRLLRRRGRDEGAETPKCYVCGEATGYRRSHSGKYICRKHTEPATTMCVPCSAERKPMKL